MPKKRKTKKKEKERSPPPISGAGLITFYQEEIKGIPIKPIYVIISSILLTVLVILANLGIFTI